MQIGPAVQEDVLARREMKLNPGIGGEGAFFGLDGRIKMLGFGWPLSSTYCISVGSCWLSCLLCFFGRKKRWMIGDDRM